MNKSNAILIIETFSQKEIGLFRLFLNSPFHNKNSKVIKLFEIISKYYPEFEIDKISKENLFRAMFGKLKYKESYIRNLLSDLNILAEKFLQYTHKPSDFSYEKFLIEELNSRKLYKLVREKIAGLDKRINPDKIKDQNYYLNKIFIYDMSGLTVSDKSLTAEFSIHSITNKIKLFIITILESYFQLMVEEQRVKISHNYDFLNHTLEFLNKHISEFKDSPFLLIYYYMWQSFFNKDGDSYFLKARSLFRKHFNSFSQTDKKNIYAVFQIFCLKKINSNVISYNKILLDIIFEMLRNKVTSHTKDIVNLNLFRNIVIICFRINAVKLLKKFISEYSDSVEIKNRSSLYAYSNAHLSFLLGKFENTLEYCNKINFSELLISTNENLYFKNDIKSLVLKCLFELGYNESALNYIDAYRHFLYNSKIIKDSLKKNSLFFLITVNDLIKLRFKFDGYKAKKLKDTVSKKEYFNHKDWILQKISEFSEKKIIE